MSDEQILVPFVQMDFGAGFVTVDDVVSDVKVDWGVHSAAQDERVAGAGSMQFELDNSAQCSGGVLGYYAVGSPNARAGFGIGTPVRLALSHDFYGKPLVWVGTIESATPSPTVTSPRTVVHAVDWMAEAERAKLAGMAVQVDVQSDALFATLVAAMDTPPPGGTLSGSGSDIYPFALDDAQDEQNEFSTILQRLALSEYGLVYVTAGVLIFEGRRRRAGAGSVRFAMGDGVIIALGVSHERDDVLNRVQVSIHPRRRDTAATSVLFSLSSGAEVQRNTSVVLQCPYRDPAQRAQRVGGVDMVAPVASTDYVGNTAEDGSGSDITSQFTVTSVPGGNSASVTVTNNGPLDGWITTLQLRGRGLYNFEPVISDIRDDASITAYGENPLAYDMPYQALPANALDTAQFLLNLNKAERTRATTVTYLANWSLETVEQAFNLAISDRVSITCPTAGLDGAVFFVNGITMEVRRSGLVLVTYDLSPADLTEYWLLEVTGRTELDQTTVLGYGLFVAGWLLDSSVLATDTFLA